MERTGQGDPAKVIPLLWRTGDRPARRGLTVERIVSIAVDLADESGLTGLSMRRLAERLGVAVMSLYTHIPGRLELIELMVDQVHLQFSRTALPDPHAGGSPLAWRNALEHIATRNRALLQHHSWLLEIDLSRPPLGPGTMAKYENELRCLVGTGLSDVDIDQALTLVLSHTAANARNLVAIEGGRSTGADSDEQWWAQAYRLLQAFATPEDFPTATRVGTAAGEAYGAAVDPERAFTFGLRVILDGLEALMAGRSGGGRPTPDQGTVR